MLSILYKQWAKSIRDRMNLPNITKPLEMQTLQTYLDNAFAILEPIPPPPFPFQQMDKQQTPWLTLAPEFRLVDIMPGTKITATSNDQLIESSTNASNKNDSLNKESDSRDETNVEKEGKEVAAVDMTTTDDQPSKRRSTRIKRGPKLELSEENRIHHQKQLTAAAKYERDMWKKRATALNKKLEKNLCYRCCGFMHPQIEFPKHVPKFKPWL